MAGGDAETARGELSHQQPLRVSFLGDGVEPGGMAGIAPRCDSSRKSPPEQRRATAWAFIDAFLPSAGHFAWTDLRGTYHAAIVFCSRALLDRYLKDVLFPPTLSAPHRVVSGLRIRWEGSI